MENRCDCEPQDQELVEQVRKEMPNFNDIANLADFFKVMGDNTRIQLLIALQHHELCVSDLSYLLDMTRSAISHQLKSLRLAKLVKARKVGKIVYYTLDDDHVEDVVLKGLHHVQHH